MPDSPTDGPLNHIALSSGRLIYANRGLISINDHLEVREGYDGPVEGLPDWDEDPRSEWTPEERRELADRMIGLWQRFKGDSDGR